jgi:hypothetical protein
VGIVLMSGHPEAEAMTGLPDACRPRFVPKPYTKVGLLRAVEAAWEDAQPSGGGRT